MNPHVLGVGLKDCLPYSTSGLNGPAPDPGWVWTSPKYALNPRFCVPAQALKWHIWAPYPRVCDTYKVVKSTENCTISPAHASVGHVFRYISYTIVKITRSGPQHHNQAVSPLYAILCDAGRTCWGPVVVCGFWVRTWCAGYVTGFCKYRL